MKRSLKVAFAALAIANIALAADNTLGAWKFNTAKSKQPAGIAPITSLTVVREGTNGGSKTTVTGERGDGSKIDTSYAATYDGKESPVTGSGIPWDTVAIKQVNANTLTETRTKKGGPYHATARDVVSNGGKTMTLTAKGTGSDGKPFTAVSVYDKQ